MGNTATKEEEQETPIENVKESPTKTGGGGGDNSEKKKIQLDFSFPSSKSKALRDPEEEKEPEVTEENLDLVPPEEDDSAALREPFDPENYDPSKYGPILPNGEINWECPCLGGAAKGPCGTEFRAAFSCFHYSKEEPKGADCFPAFEGMHVCFSKYPDLYKSRPSDDDDEDEEEGDNEEVEFDEEERKLIDDEEDKANNSRKEEEKAKKDEEKVKPKTKQANEPVKRKEPLIPPARQPAVL